MKDKILKFIRLILVIVIIVCLFLLGRRGYDYYKNYKNNKHISDIVKNVEKDQSENGSNDNLNDFEKLEKKYMAILKKLQKENSDIVAFLEIPGTYISYPIFQAKDNNFYLRKGIDKNYDIAGSIFMDYMNDPKINDDNSVIYGHHLDDIKSMFTGLDGYRKNDFAQSHRTIYITTNEGLREYQVFAAYGIPSNYDYRTLDFEDKEEKLKYFDKLKSNSENELETRDFKEDDTIITLSTCQYDYKDQRLAVHALRIK
ncbi:SrtB family sortase [Anaerococcus sp. HMSC075B03]|uniref:class B sortase n=1 Tax=unclassified Anaerococcus TaxID=2614126 RepID=UPI0008A3FE01|nr:MULTISPECIES: class B sortase [unclassified Anaerococcus]OFJ70903.1 SrtB family sortase [Anaerococcus sp. HMSC065G05]OFO42378.1 SrtB family sortase [Anaerococcus sp. HMSC075B03]